MSAYPVTIIAARYSGTYEGAAWVAFNEYHVPDDAQADDVTCAVFFGSYDKPLGRGRTPDAALRDLELHLASPPNAAEPGS